MGYNPRPSTVTKFAPVLEDIKAAIDSGREINFPAPLEEIPRRRDRLHDILNSAKRFPQREGGRYADLRDRTEVSVDWDAQAIVVRPKHTRQQMASRAPSEFDAAKQLSGGDEAYTLQFKPSSGFDPEYFDRLIREQYGYTIKAKEDDPGDPYLNQPSMKKGDFVEQSIDAKGWKCYIAVPLEQAKPEPKTDLLKQFGFSRSDS